MTGIDPNRLQRRLRWAAEQLEVSPDASPDEVRAAWLRRLAEDDFVPSSDSRQALEVFLQRHPEGGWLARADEAAAQWEEEQLRAEVEAFAAEFWNLSVEERRQRWENLAERCAFAPALRVRMDQLGTGLDIVAPLPRNDARVSELVEHVRELFVLRPGPRARLRQSLLAQMRNKWSEWRTAAHRLRHAAPAFDELGIDLLGKLRTTTPAVARQSPPKSLPQPDQQTANQPSKLGYLWIIIALGGAFLRLVSSDNKPSSSSRPPFTFPYKPLPSPKIDPPPQFDWEKVLDKQQIQDEKTRKELKEIFESLQKKGQPGKQDDKGDKTDRKFP